MVGNMFQRHNADIIELKQAYNKAKQDQSFQDELTYLKEYVGEKPH